jgi:hypothetical protein
MSSSADPKLNCLALVQTATCGENYSIHLAILDRSVRCPFQSSHGGTSTRPALHDKNNSDRRFKYAESARVRRNMWGKAADGSYISGVAIDQFISMPE